MAFKAAGREFRVNRYTDDVQKNPSIAANPATGGFQVVWQSDGQDGFLWGVYGQNFAAAGKKRGPEISIADLTAGDQENPDVAFNEDGSGMWVWQSTAQISLSARPTSAPRPTTFPGENYEVRSKTFGFESSSASEVYVPYEVNRENTQSNSNIDDDLIDISVSSLGGDRFLTNWYSKDEPRDEFVHMVELVSANTFGEDVSGEILFGTAEEFGKTNYGDAQYWRTVESRRFGELDEFLVVSGRSDFANGVGGVIQVQVFQDDPTDGSFNYDDRLNTDYNGQYRLTQSGKTGSALRPHVAVLNNERFVITWMELDQRNADSDKWEFDVYAQIFNGDLTTRSPLLHVGTGAGDQVLPEIATLKDGTFAITWTDRQGDDDVHLQRFNDKGWKIGNEVKVNNTGKGHQGDADLAVLNNGKLALTWESTQASGEVMARIFNVQKQGNAQAQVIEGTSAKDRISVGAKNDKVDGGNGRDTIFGGTGNDTLLGGDGNDRIVGGGGKDRIDGGKGNDTMTGNAGADKFVFRDGKDTITDFQNNQDMILIERSLGPGKRLTLKKLDALAERVDGDLVFDFGKGDVLTIEGVRRFSAVEDEIGFV